MVPPVESMELPEKKIAIRNDTYFNEDEKLERLTYEEIWLKEDDDNSTLVVNQTGLRQLSVNATTNATEPAKERNVFYYAIIDALEIRIVAQNPDDGERDQIDMSYDVIEFSPRYIDI